MNCPICGRPVRLTPAQRHAINPAVQLARRKRNRPLNLSEAERSRRAEAMAQARLRRWPARRGS